MHDLEMPLNSRLSYDDRTPFQIWREHHLSDTKIHFDPFMNSVRMTFEHYTSKQYTTISNMGGMTPSQICVTFFIILIGIIITILGIYYGCIKAGSQEYGIEGGMDVETVTHKILLDENKSKEVESYFKGIVEKQTKTEHVIGNLTKHVFTKDAKHELDLAKISEGHHSTRIGMITGTITVIFVITGAVLIIVYKMTINHRTVQRQIAGAYRNPTGTNAQDVELFPPITLS